METFEYIVVGSGSAGSVVAGRLAEDGASRVLLLEAGPPDEDFWIHTPAGMGKLFLNERFNWNYYTEPLPELAGRRLYWPRGKVLGGSSAINGMVFLRGHRGDYEQWKGLGNAGWGWDDVLPFFKSMEHCELGESSARGRDGPLSVTAPALQHPAAMDFIEAARRCGLAKVDDLNGHQQEGAAMLQHSIRDGRRHSAYDAFVRPLLKRGNLSVRAGVQVQAIAFEGRRASGVRLVDGGHSRTILATREVIVCAGAINSPQLLMLSGIGDGERLRALDIPLVHHLPGVGRNLQDHLTVRVQARVTPASSYNLALTGWRKYLEGARYLLTHGGYLALGSSLAGALVRSRPALDYPDLAISFRPMTFSYMPSGELQVDSYPGISASVFLVRPASRGEIALRSRDPLQAPAITPGYLRQGEDVRAMLSGIRQLRAILATQPIAARVLEETAPGAGIVTDEQLEAYLRQQAGTAFHPAGTCRMGNDAQAVVDERLRVQGIEHLRVVDASIMPTITATNTNAPTMMIGEKGAHLIRADAVAGATV